ncbi:MAG: hypothetical protein HFE57_14280 [Firmicutes bacterium]|jgi:hypothetical protein|nr:hypothetical protein [Bacillota bacterium]
MTQKEKFLAIQSYEEFNARREEFKGLSTKDKEIREHLKVFGKLKNYTEEEFDCNGKRLYRCPELQPYE